MVINVWSSDQNISIPLKYVGDANSVCYCSVAIVSDGNYLKDQSVVLLGPGPITSGERNEFISKFSYETLIELYTKLLKETCF